MIMVNKNYLYLKSWENNGISQIRDILNENGEFLKCEELKQKYNIITTFLQTIQVQKSIPTPWIQKTKNCRITKNIHNKTDGIYIKINNSLLPVSKTTCKATIGTSGQTIRKNIDQIQLKNGALFTKNLIMPVKRFWKEFLNNLLNAAGTRRYKVFNLELFIELFHVTNGLKT